MSFKKAFDYLIRQAEDNLDLDARLKMVMGSKQKKSKRLDDYRDQLPSHRTITYNDLKLPVIKDFFKRRKLHSWHVRWHHLSLCMDPNYHGFIMFPLMINNHPVSYQLRHLTRKQYHNGSNLDKFLFNEGEIKDGHPVILVEGFLDFVNVDSYIRANCRNRVSCVTGGLKSVSSFQIERLRSHAPSQLIVMFDGDSWFDYYRIKKSIPYDVNYIILPKDKDPNDLSWHELEQIFKKEIEPCFTNRAT